MQHFKCCLKRIHSFLIYTNFSPGSGRSLTCAVSSTATAQDGAVRQAYLANTRISCTSLHLDSDCIAVLLRTLCVFVESFFCPCSSVIPQINLCYPASKETYRWSAKYFPPRMKSPDSYLPPFCQLIPIFPAPRLPIRFDIRKVTVTGEKVGLRPL